MPKNKNNPFFFGENPLSNQLSIHFSFDYMGQIQQPM